MMHRALKALAFGTLVMQSHGFNNPPGVDIWCGKAYSNASFDPGGWLEQPPESATPLLNLQIRPRWSFYTDAEKNGSFVVDAAISNLVGVPYTSLGHQSSASTSLLHLKIRTAGARSALLADAVIHAGSVNNIIPIRLEQLVVSAIPYDITLMAATNGHQYHARTQLSYLPNSAGSSVRIDSLYQSLLVPDPVVPGGVAPIYPYSYYTSWQDYLVDNSSNVRAFKDQGYNIVHIIPDSSKEYGVDSAAFDAFMDECDEIGLWVMYDMRYTYKNASSVTYQVNRVKDRKSFLLYYTGDEPDGVGDPLNSTIDSYALIKSIDPYHPVALCLNCYNFYYQQYAAGADIIMEDVYPIGINATYSTVYHVPCNTTYGDCGCDDCTGDGVTDIAVRLDLLAQYQRWLGGPPKPLWGVPQAFGDSEYWATNPTPAEIAAMSAISLNHGAKGLVAWTYPTLQSIEDATSRLAKIYGSAKVTRYTLTAPLMPLRVRGGQLLDAAGWEIDGSMLISILNPRHDDLNGRFELDLKRTIVAVESVILGSNWSVENGTLLASQLSGLANDMLVVRLE